MNIVDMVRQWRSRQKGLDEEKNKMLLERLARLFNEGPITDESRREDQDEERIPQDSQSKKE
jgi:hypothetical protein